MFYHLVDRQELENEQVFTDVLLLDRWKINDSISHRQRKTDLVKTILRIRSLIHSYIGDTKSIPLNIINQETTWLRAFLTAFGLQFPDQRTDSRWSKTPEDRKSSDPTGWKVSYVPCFSNFFSLDAFHFHLLSSLHCWILKDKL